MATTQNPGSIATGSTATIAVSPIQGLQKLLIWSDAGDGTLKLQFRPKDTSGNYEDYPDVSVSVSSGGAASVEFTLSEAEVRGFDFVLTPSGVATEALRYVFGRTAALAGRDLAKG